MGRHRSRERRYICPYVRTQVLGGQKPLNTPLSSLSYCGAHRGCVCWGEGGGGVISIGEGRHPPVYASVKLLVPEGPTTVLCAGVNCQVVTASICTYNIVKDYTNRFHTRTLDLSYQSNHRIKFKEILLCCTHDQNLQHIKASSYFIQWFVFGIVQTPCYGT